MALAFDALERLGGAFVIFGTKAGVSGPLYSISPFKLPGCGMEMAL